MLCFGGPKSMEKALRACAVNVQLQGDNVAVRKIALAPQQKLQSLCGSYSLNESFRCSENFYLHGAQRNACPRSAVAMSARPIQEYIPSRRRLPCRL